MSGYQHCFEVLLKILLKQFLILFANKTKDSFEEVVIPNSFFTTLLRNNLIKILLLVMPTTKLAWNIAGVGARKPGNLGLCEYRVSILPTGKVDWGNSHNQCGYSSSE